MNGSEYPQDLTGGEARLGFQLLRIEGIAQDCIDLDPGPVVARVLSPSDALIKARMPGGEAFYSHRRYGYTILNGKRSDLRWHLISGPHSDAVAFLHELQFGDPQDVYGDVIGLRFLSSPATA